LLLLRLAFLKKTNAIFSFIAWAGASGAHPHHPKLLKTFHVSDTFKALSSCIVVHFHQMTGE
jgi:hypothetical protein